MIITQWTAADTAFVKKFDAEKAELNDDDNFDGDGRELVNFPVHLDELPPLDVEYPVTLDAEMVAELDEEAANLSGDPIARGC